MPQELLPARLARQSDGAPAPSIFADDEIFAVPDEWSVWRIAPDITGVATGDQIVDCVVAMVQVKMINSDRPRCGRVLAVSKCSPVQNSPAPVARVRTGADCVKQHRTVNSYDPLGIS